MQQYTELLNIQLLHEYYKDEVCREVSIRPDQETANWLRNVGGLFRAKGPVWAILIPSTLDLAAESQAKSDFQLQFECSSGNPGFFTFTDTPLNELGQIVFSDDEVVYSGQSTIDLKGNFESQSSPLNKVATIVLSLANLAAAKQEWPLIYTARFSTRSVQWKYFFITQQNSACEKLVLKKEGSNLFEQKEEETIPGGVTAKVFSSGENKIALKERSSLDMTLACEQTTGEEVLLDHLPNAGPSSLQIPKEGEGLLYAAIYVYL